MRISDWSSDVCSSDLLNLHRVPQDRVRRLAGNPRDIIGVGDFRGGDRGGIVERAEQQRGPEAFPKEVLHAACHTCTAKRIAGGRTYVDRHAARRDRAVPYRTETIFAALDAGLIFAQDARSLFQQADAAVVRINVAGNDDADISGQSEEHTSELQSLMRSSYAVFCLKKKKPHKI